MMSKLAGWMVSREARNIRGLLLFLITGLALSLVFRGEHIASLYDFLLEWFIAILGLGGFTVTLSRILPEWQSFIDGEAKSNTTESDRQQAFTYVNLTLLLLTVAVVMLRLIIAGSKHGDYGG